VAGKIGLDNTVAGDQTFIDQWLNEAYEEVLHRTRCKVASQDVTPNAADYSLGTTILQILKLYTTSSGQSYEVTRVSVDDLIDMRRANASPPTRYYALVGADKVLFYPTPAATDTFTMYYVARPAALSASGDSPSDIPSEFHKLLEFYALAEGADYDDDQSSAQGQRYRDLYEQGISGLRAYMKKKGGTKAPGFRIGRRTPVRPTVPSEDV
jgi:hypothetical protein